MFASLSKFPKIQEINCNRFKKHQKLDADPKAIQEINFTGNLDGAGGPKIFLHYWKNERNSFRCFRRNS